MCAEDFKTLRPEWYEKLNISEAHTLFITCYFDAKSLHNTG